MASFFSIEIPRRSSCCVKGGEKLYPGMDYYSLLQEEGKTFLRKDFCLHCWEEPQKGEQLMTYWRSKVQVKESQIPSSAPKHLKALSLLKEMCKEPASIEENELFILALYLARAKQLILRKEWEQEGQVYYLYEIVESEEIVTIKKVDLSLLNIENIQQKLAQKLNDVCKKA
jgi:hypothetical protein